MRILALSTASPALSLALFEDGALIAHDHRIIGRGHAEALMPAIIALMGDTRADHIIIDNGPGSFTGIRIGIAAARALGFAWSVPVTGCESGSLVAARAFALRPDLDAVTIMLDAGRGQILHQRIARDFIASPITTIAPGDVTLTGSDASAGPLAPAGAVHDGQPDTAYALHLPLRVRSLAPTPLYIRPPDAILPL